MCFFILHLNLQDCSKMAGVKYLKEVEKQQAWTFLNQVTVSGIQS